MRLIYLSIQGLIFGSMFFGVGSQLTTSLQLFNNLGSMFLSVRLYVYLLLLLL